MKCCTARVRVLSPHKRILWGEDVGRMREAGAGSVAFSILTNGNATGNRLLEAHRLIKCTKHVDGCTFYDECWTSGMLAAGGITGRNEQSIPAFS